MGNIFHKTSENHQAESSEDKMREEFTPVNEFKFHDPLEADLTNGLCLNNVYLPEEVVSNILSYVPPNDLLQLTLVCKEWCNIIKSDSFWMSIYSRHFPNRIKKLPWYVFYNYFTTGNFTNMLKNGNGQNQFHHWKIIKNFGDEFKIEDPPVGADPLPADVPEFNGYSGCFVTSFYECHKIQIIKLNKKRLLRYILNKYKPNIHISEWVAGRFDCGCMYNLGFRGYSNKKYVESMDLEDSYIKPLFHVKKELVINQWEGRSWQKVEAVVEKCPPNVYTLIFEHEGHDTQFWKGHYGSKMAGGVVRVDIDSIQLIDTEEDSVVTNLNPNANFDI